MIFSVGIQFQNNDIHTMNIKALSFNHVNKKLGNYCAFLNKKYSSNDYFYKRASIACEQSCKFDKDYPLVAIGNKTVNGDPVVTHHSTEKLVIL